MRQEVQETLLRKLQSLADEDQRLAVQLEDPAVLADHQQVRALSIQRSAVADMVKQYRRYRQLQDEIAQHAQIIATEKDRDLVELAQSEIGPMKEQAQALLDQLADEIVTADDRAVGSVILEIRAAAGGAEGALWAGNLFQMYQKFADRRGWSMDMLEWSEGEQGGIRQVVANIQGPGVWQGLGYEGGVHCVKRVPATETQGRIHTSTATVAVLPEPQKLDIQIPDSDVQMHITTAQGPGGQNVNKVATAVHMIHVPTGIEVRMQESKSQQQNRVKAWTLLRARVYDHYQRIKQAERSESRSKMIGSGERSERIRTFRWKENIVVDHRLSESFNLQSVLAGELEPVVEALIAQDKAQRLAAM
ncbi:MAG: PCRF domain-containing protein [Phycisphaeraceae bacterium]|nr:PCRF domain-containing protein [Phycisphaeraceae bacterium]